MTNCHGKLDALLGKIAPDEREGGFAVFAWGEASGHGDELRDMAGLGAAEHAVLLDVSDDDCENDVAHVLYVGVLRGEPATADESGSTLEEGETLSGREGFVQNVREEFRLSIVSKGAVLPCLEVHGRVLGKAGPVSTRVVGGLVHAPARDCR